MNRAPTATRSTSDEINDKVMKDPRMADMMKPENMLSDRKCMLYGGFEAMPDGRAPGQILAEKHRDLR